MKQIFRYTLKIWANTTVLVILADEQLFKFKSGNLVHIDFMSMALRSIAFAMPFYLTFLIIALISDRKLKRVGDKKLLFSLAAVILTFCAVRLAYKIYTVDCENWTYWFLSGAFSVITIVNIWRCRLSDDIPNASVDEADTTLPSNG